MTTKHCLFLSLCLFLIACADPNYNGKNYVSFETMDELADHTTESIRLQDEDKMLQLLENDALLFDLLKNASGEDAQKTKAYLSTKEGKKNFEISQLSKKQRINAFFSTGLAQQVTINKAAFQKTGLELVSETPYAKGSPAMLQSYRIMLNNGDGQAYAYDIQVIHWNNRYHLVEAAGFLDKP